jgi:hypothetical protein
VEPGEVVGAGMHSLGTNQPRRKKTWTCDPFSSSCAWYETNSRALWDNYKQILKEKTVRAGQNRLFVAGSNIGTNLGLCHLSKYPVGWMRTKLIFAHASCKNIYCS